MKPQLLILIAILISCTNGQEKQENVVLKPIDIVETLAPTPEVDTTEKVVFPKYLTEGYVAEYYDTSFVKKFSTLNDSITVGHIEMYDGVCLIEILRVFKNENEVDEVTLLQNCDHDLSQPDITWLDYSKSDSLKFIVTETIEYIADSLLTENGRIPEGFNFEDYNTMQKINKTQIEVSHNGTLIKTNAND